MLITKLAKITQKRGVDVWIRMQIFRVTIVALMRICVKAVVGMVVECTNFCVFDPRIGGLCLDIRVVVWFEMGKQLVIVL